MEVAQGEGKITPSSGTHQFYENENIEIEAEPEEEWEFDKLQIGDEEIDSAETAIEELSKDKVIKASFSRLEEDLVQDDKEEVEPEKTPVAEKDMNDYVDHLISSTAGHSTNTGYKRIVDFWAEGQNNNVLNLRLQGDENFTTGMTRGGIMDNTEDIIKQVFEEREDISTLKIEWYMVLIDQKGQENNTNIITIEFSRQTYNEINWDRFLRENLPNVADYFWAHPNYR
ncbi:hypothetical protein [Halarsenatibacter silvermanii]|uniref:Uncharacterized protein n=1 Tax=Halarsenatibacter silvermanii TaxID=321763 RepID=A0A1G9R2D1_9FIRM|nr:hypothetical protein [Halarsenatibacter silvermanii]SDM17270.1 hypothetical protein SAMN04488692_11949 [Halarsenatibacter silvermanii]